MPTRIRSAKNKFQRRTLVSSLMSIVETLIQGVLLGGLYALFALGQALMFGVMRLTNTAHGDFIILSAFAALAVVASGINPFIGGLVVLPLAFAVGYGLQRFHSTVRSARTRCHRWSSPLGYRSSFKIC